MGLEMLITDEKLEDNIHQQKPVKTVQERWIQWEKNCWCRR
ncbi:unnamed protein product [Brassica oleracea]